MKKVVQSAVIAGLMLLYGVDSLTDGGLPADGDTNCSAKNDNCKEDGKAALIGIGVMAGVMLLGLLCVCLRNLRCIQSSIASLSSLWDDGEAQPLLQQQNSAHVAVTVPVQPQ